MNELPHNSGILYIVWGDVENSLQRSIRSVKAVHPELLTHIQRLPPTATLLDKANMLDFTPFEHTLYLDADTVVLRPLNFGFAKAERHALACCICECPWARRYGGIDGDTIEYNTGVLFFSRSAKSFFQTWKSCAGAIDSSCQYEVSGQIQHAPLNDQAGFAKAVEESGIGPFVLPPNWNFRPRFFKSYMGPIHIWHEYDDPPPQFLQLNQDPRQDGKILPFTILR